MAISTIKDTSKISLTGTTNNTIVTVTGENALAGEANLTFNGSTLAVTGAATISTTLGIGGTPSEELTILKAQNSGTTAAVRNTTAGTAAQSTVRVQANAGGAYLRAHSSSFTTSSQSIQDGALLQTDSNLSGGLAISVDHSTADLSFWTGQGSQRMTIDGASGNVGIGTIAPDGNLHVFHSSAGTLTASSYADVFVIESNESNGLSILTTDHNYGQIFWSSYSDGGGLGGNNARIAAGYNSGTPRLDFSVGASNNMMTLSAGNVTLSGALSKGSGSFRIRHPLESRDGYDLVHSFIEGPQADLIYRGTATLTDGAATVNIDTAARITDGTFVALVNNVQAFTTNETEFDGVRASVSGNILTIESEDADSTATISWMVVGERKDAHMLDTDWTDSDGRVITEPETIVDSVLEPEEEVEEEIEEEAA
jgi:hypothetical protein